jgi:hypothetical protein
MNARLVTLRLNDEPLPEEDPDGPDATDEAADEETDEETDETVTLP